MWWLQCYHAIYVNNLPTAFWFWNFSAVLSQTNDFFLYIWIKIRISLFLTDLVFNVNFVINWIFSNEFFNTFFQLHFFPYKAPIERSTTRTQNPFFRRRYGFTSTPKPLKTLSTVGPETASLSGIGNARNSDQEHEPSILDKKFSHNNQIDLGTELINQGLAEAITSISRAPLPFIASTTVRNVKITTPGGVKYDDVSEYQISKRADSLSSGCK